MQDKPHFQSDIWLDEAQPENEFIAEQSYCRGYQVFGELTNKANIIEYWLLLFTGEKPNRLAVSMLKKIAIALANLGPRSEAIRAAMNAGVGGSSAASYLIAALAVGAGQHGGAREVFTLVNGFAQHGCDLQSWLHHIMHPNQDRTREDVWDEYQHIPGFNQHACRCSEGYLTLLEDLCEVASPNGPVYWLKQTREQLETYAGHPLNLSFIVASVMHELALNAEKAELLYLIMILPGAAVHALEAKHQGWKRFPFFGQAIALENDPGVIGPLPNIEDDE